MSKIAITADIHFGVPGRLRDILWACKVLREYCKVASIDTVVVLGDLFHDRKALDIETLSHIARFFEEVSEDPYNQQWIVFPGNHDMFLRYSWKINSLQILRKHLTVIEDLKILQLDDTRFWVLPFISFEKSYRKVLSRMNKRAEDGDYLFTHVGVCNAKMNTCFLLQNWSIINFDDSPFRRIYTGHFHNRQQIGDNTFYPGSLIPFKFDEGDIAHGFYCLDLESGDHKFINIWKAGAKLLPDEAPAPQFCTLLDDLLPEKAQEDISGNVVRVAIQRDYTTDEKRSIHQQLTGMGAVGVRWMSLFQKRDQEVVQKEQQDTSKDIFRSWYEKDKEKGAKDLDEKVLVTAHTDVIQEADEIYALEEAEV